MQTLAPQVAGKVRWAQLLLLLFLLPLSSCSDRTLSLFFDIPPPTPEELAAERAEAEAAAEQAKAEETEAPAPAVEETAPAEPEERPAIESVHDWKQVWEMLPKDKKGRKGKINWTQAVREGLIKPRETIDGSPRPFPFVFKYDFFIPAEEKGFEVYFPHSTHTEWLDCQSCHPRIFPTRNIAMTKKDLKKGKYCGVCHAKKGGTAFWLRSCNRCHPRAS